jgi:hypothetical protein
LSRLCPTPALPRENFRSLQDFGSLHAAELRTSIYWDPAWRLIALLEKEGKQYSYQLLAIGYQSAGQPQPFD